MTTDGDETKVRLLAEARDLYLEQGVAEFSLREVARRTGVSAAAVYRHFDGREALLQEVCAQGFRIFLGYLMAALSAPSPRERMASSAEQYLRFGLDHPSDYRVIFMGPPANLVARAPAAESRKREPTFQFLVDRVRECMEAGVLRQGAPEEIAVIIWCHVHGLVSLRLSGHLGLIGSDEHFARLYVRATERLIAGLGG